MDCLKMENIPAKTASKRNSVYLHVFSTQF